MYNGDDGDDDDEESVVGSNASNDCASDQW